MTIHWILASYTKQIPELKQILTPLCYSALVLMKSPCRGPTFRIKRFAWQLLTDESQRGIMHFDIGHVLWGWAAQLIPDLAPASPQTNNNNMSSCLTQLLRPKIISTLKWDDTLIKMPSIFQEKTRRTILFPSKDLYQVRETLKSFFLTHIQLCVTMI